MAKAKPTTGDQRVVGINAAITDAQVLETSNHVEMMKRQHLWGFFGRALPLIRVLPEFKDGSNTEAGCILALDDEPPFRVRLTNLFALAFGQPVDGVPFIDYDTAEAVAADGWKVD